MSCILKIVKIFLFKKKKIVKIFRETSANFKPTS